MTTDPLALLDEVDRATARLLATAGGLGPGALADASLLPGWSRGHVLTHAARNADAMRNLLTWARTGEVTPAYPSRAARDAAIQDGASRPPDEQVADLRDSCERFARAAADMPAEAWRVQLPLDRGPMPAALIVWGRLREVEVHHVDLTAGYGPADWPDSFTHRLLHEVAAHLRGTDLTIHAAGLGHPLAVGVGGPPSVSGPAAPIAGWLIGRVPEPDVTVEPTGSLPILPEWL